MNKLNHTIVAVVVASLILMCYAFFNGYPLVTADTGAYTYFAYDFAILKDRSSFYSVWLAVAGLRTLNFIGIRGSFWAPVFFQCAILAVLLLRYYRLIAGRKPAVSHYLLAVVLIALLSAASWTAAYIMPDVFAAVLLLTLALYFFDEQANAKIRWVYLCLAGFAILVHNSHFLIAPLCCVIMFVYAWLAKQSAVKMRALKVLLVSAGCWLLVCSINFVYGFGFQLSSGSHVFMAGKLVEAGTMKQYLDEQCGKKDYQLCAYRNELPELAYQYIWLDSSPFYKIGGWENSAAEHKAIIRDVFTTPRYIFQFARRAMKDTWQQLQYIYVQKEAYAFEKWSVPSTAIQKHVMAEHSQFLNARQQRGNIDNGLWINIQSVALILSLLWVGFLLVQGTLPRRVMEIYLVVILFLVCNAFVTASFANVLDRLQNRVAWVLPATNIILLISYYTAKLRPRAND